MRNENENETESPLDEYVPDHLKGVEPGGRGEIKERRLSNEEMAVVSMFDVDGVGSALLSSGFDVEEKVLTLVEIARNESAKASARIRAMKEIQDMAREALEVNGLMGKASVRTVSDDGHGGQQIQEASTRRLLVSMEKQNERRYNPNSDEGIITHPAEDENEPA